MRIFVTGASGYIGGSVAVALKAAGHEIAGLVRSPEAADGIRKLGFDPVMGDLDSRETLMDAAGRADAVVNAAHADHEAAATALMDALSGTGKMLLHTSGSSVVGTQAGGKRVDDVFDEETPFEPSPGRAARAALNKTILASKERGVHAVILCPSLIYGLGAGHKRHSMQVPWLIETAKRHGVARHFGPGENIWSNVHVSDLADLYLLALDKAPAGSFYFAENGEASMAEMCRAIGRMLGFGDRSEAMSLDEAAGEWGRGAAENTMGSNSRVRAVRARSELGWSPKARSVIEEIETGCYRDAV